MKQQKRRIAVLGAGGHGKVVVDAIERNDELVVACVADDNPKSGAKVLGHAVVGDRAALLARRSGFDGVIVAIGDNRTRMAAADWLVAQGFSLQSVVHPSAMVAGSAVIGVGTLIMPLAVVHTDARLGANVIVNSGAIVEHDCEIGDGVHVAPGAVLCGSVVVEAGAFIGAGVVIVPGVRIGAGLLVKAGTTVTHDVIGDA